jgi:cell division septal protein FtsQ
MKRRIRDRSKFQINLNIFKILSIVLIVVFVLLTPVMASKLVKINKIECSSQYGSCEESVMRMMPVLGNYKDTKKYIEQELSKNIQINAFLIQYKIPSTLKVELDIKKPVSAIKNSSSQYYLIDNDGVVLSSSTESILPTVNRGDALYKMGENISDSDKFALDILTKVSYLYTINEGESDGKELKLKLNEALVARFPLSGDVDVLVGSLRLIFSRLNENVNGIRMEDTREIDLRFRNVVLR